MQRYFVSKNNSALIFKESDIHHIKNVMRMKVGDQVEAVADHSLYLATISSLTPFEVTFHPVNNNEDKLPLLNITIAVALVKEQKMDLILQKLTELGVSRIIPLNMERSIVKLDSDRFAKKKERWKKICKEASEQSKRTDIPIITDIMNLKDLINEEAGLKLVASTKENKLFNSYLQKATECAKIIMVIGPEGGISEKEETFLNENGFSPVSFGPLIFRVETACFYAASILNYFSSTR